MRKSRGGRRVVCLPGTFKRLRSHTKITIKKTSDPHPRPFAKKIITRSDPREIFLDPRMITINIYTLYLNINQIFTSDTRLPQLYVWNNKIFIRIPGLSRVS